MSGFAVAQFFREEGSEFNAPLAEGLVADLDAALVEQFLYVSVTQGETVVKPDSVLNDDHGGTVAVRLGVGHGGSAYPNPIKATQSFLALEHHGVSAARQFANRV